MMSVLCISSLSIFRLPSLQAARIEEASVSLALARYSIDTLGVGMSSFSLCQIGYNIADSGFTGCLIQEA